MIDISANSDRPRHSSIITVPFFPVDAAYEAVQKRTFLPMSIKIITFLPVLIGLIVLYKYLQPASEEPSYSELPSEEEDKEESDEEKEADKGHSVELQTLMNDSH